MEMPRRRSNESRTKTAPRRGREAVSISPACVQNKQRMLGRVPKRLKTIVEMLTVKISK
jgi:hypothetical protein